MSMIEKNRFPVGDDCTTLHAYTKHETQGIDLSVLYDETPTASRISVLQGDLEVGIEIDTENEIVRMVSMDNETEREYVGSVIDTFLPSKIWHGENDFMPSVMTSDGLPEDLRYKADQALDFVGADILEQENLCPDSDFTKNPVTAFINAWESKK